MEEEDIVLFKRNNPSDFAISMIERLPLNYHQGVLNAAAMVSNAGVPTEDEWTNYGRSMWKKAYMLWTCLDPRHKRDPKTQQPLALMDGVKWCLRILYDASLASEMQLNEIMAKIQIVSQEDAIKNWYGPTDQGVGGPPQAETPAAKDSTKESDTAAGPGFSNTSPENTNTPENRFSDYLPT